MLLEEYDEKTEQKYLGKEAIEIGWREGLEKGLKQDRTRKEFQESEE